jgi:hypothetical protein
MIRKAAGVGVVLADRRAPTVAQKAVEHMGCLGGSRHDGAVANGAN